MSKGKLNKKALKIVGATSIALFSLVTVFTATIAWFALNQTVGSDNMSVKITDETGRLNKIEIYEYVETINKGTEQNPVLNYSFNNTPSAVIYGGSDSDEDYYQMGNFTPLDTEHHILILFTFQEDFVSTTPGDMFIKGITTADGFLGATVNKQPKYNLGRTAPTLWRGSKDVPVINPSTGEVVTDPSTGEAVTKTVDCYPLSSVVNFKGAEYSANQYNALKTNSTTGRIDIPTNSISKRAAFMDFATYGDGSDFTKEPTIFESAGEGETIKHIALIVNYDEDAIIAIYSTYLGNKILEENYGGDLYFTCDWSLEVF